MRPRDLAAYNIPQIYLYALYQQGKIVRLSRGVYASSYNVLTQHHSFVEVCKRVPHGVICLLSALQFHELTTQLPFEVWLAIDRRAHKPNLEGTPLRITRFSGKALETGIERHHIEGVEIAVYSPAKTVADCFKYRNKIGVDVAIEALKDTLKHKKASIQEIWECAEICRVSKVISPYLEALQ